MPKSGKKKAEAAPAVSTAQANALPAMISYIGLTHNIARGWDGSKKQATEAMDSLVGAVNDFQETIKKVVPE